MTTCALDRDEARQVEDAFQCLQDELSMECTNKVPFDELGRGANRIVYEVGNECVLKLQLPTRSTVEKSSNEREVEAWESAPQELKRHFVPITDHGNGWLMMPKVNEHDVREKGHPPYGVTQQIQDDAEDNDWRCTDVRGSNLGHNEDGDWVIFDYADCVDFSHL